MLSRSTKKTMQEETIISADTITSVIAEDCKIEGSIFSQSSIKIDGEIIGDITARGSIILGDVASVKGNLTANDVILYGKVEGDIVAESLSLKGTATVNGDSTINIFEVYKGAIYKGSVYKGVPDDREEIYKVDERTTL